ncbi:MAG TPA: CRTAC1 family protein [Puia sp.]|jgi:tetratricopeptide (TPR) repeat protein
MAKIIHTNMAVLQRPILLACLFLFMQEGCKYKDRQTSAADAATLQRLYQEGLKPAYDKNNPYCPEAELAFADSMLTNPANPERTILISGFVKGFALLNLGEEKQAIDVLQQVADRTSAFPGDKLALEARNYLALAWLRLGERNNCISGHTMGSCIFPLRGSGLYTDPSASLKSIGLYQQLLRQDHDNLELRWLLNIAYMTLGEYPTKVPAAWLIKGLDADTASVKIKPFRDMAGELKLNGNRNMSGGVIIDDFDNDGYLDIVTSCWDLEEGMHYYKNNGDGTFTDRSIPSGLAGIKGGLNILQADYNNDGFTDILVLRGAWLQELGRQPSTLLRNNGDGTFTDVTIQAGLLSLHPTQTAVWRDFNNDGWLDLFIGNETTDPTHPHPSELFINDKDGSFTDVSSQAGCSITGFIKGVVAADYNNDGWQDLFVSMLDGRKALLKNKGVPGNIPQFEEATHEAGLDRDTTYTFPTWFWDYDNDGWPDIFVCGYRLTGSLATEAAAEALHLPLGNVSRMYLYHNNRDGSFTDVSKEMGLDRPLFSMGANFGDIDNDGWLDMYLGTGNTDFRSLIPNRLFKNINGRQFIDVTRSARVGNLQKGHGVAFADAGNDGNQDIFVETGGAVRGDGYFNSFFVNPGQNDNNWISLQLEGVKANRSAIGARIEVHFTEEGVSRTVYSDVNSGGSFGASPLRKEIGIGKAAQIDELVIKWPGSGKVQSFKDLFTRQFLHIKEGEERPETMPLRSLHLDRSPVPMQAMDCAPGIRAKK